MYVPECGGSAACEWFSCCHVDTYSGVYLLYIAYHVYLCIYNESVYLCVCACVFVYISISYVYNVPARVPIRFKAPELQ